MSRTAGTVSRSVLARAGFTEAERAEGMVAELRIGPELVGPAVASLSQAASPDHALLGLVRLGEVLPKAEFDRLTALFSHNRDGWDRLVRLLGASTALTDHLVRHPEQWPEIVSAGVPGREALYVALSEAVGEATGVEGYDALRVAYYRQLLRIAAVDLTEDPVEQFPVIAEALSELAGAAVAAALRIARNTVEDADSCRLTVIGMGKCGGRELNYISDVDVIFVAEPAPGVGEADALAVGNKLATEIMRACSDATGEGSLWPVDPALRPEGKQGPLVRTVESHRAYYERWAKTWEFQALLKARPIAGDEEVGSAYLAAIQPMIWRAADRDHFVEDVQAMRRRVEDHVPQAEVGRQLKLGPGGLRDIEFSVQLLQLVHGRTDDRLRNRGTLAAIESLSRGGYIGRVDAHELDQAYRRLRVLEHRIQLSRMRRTHLIPSSSAELRALGRSVGLRADPETDVLKQWRDQAAQVRRLHERIFYRPLLSAVAKLSRDDARLTPESAQDRFAALGFRDAKGAVRHVEALTVGVSRRAAIQRTLLPVMLQWFAEEVDPDLGLLAFRKLSDALGSTHWFLKMLRDEGRAAETLAKALAGSRYVGQLLENAPSAVRVFGSTQALHPMTREQLLTVIRAAVDRQPDDDDAALLAVRSARRTELIRIAVADLTGRLELDAVERALTDLAAATLQGTLELAIRHVEKSSGQALSTVITIIGMGRLGGAEMAYASDADVMFVHQPLPDADPQLAQSQAEETVTYLRNGLSAGGPDPALVVDADLRPEGKAGPIVRTIESYAAYYERWSEGWEAQALLRATPVAGDADLGVRFTELIDPLRWPEGGIDEKAVRAIRMLKARMEAERIPRGGDVRTHFKLGRGGLSDVEWTVQLAQLQHAYEIPELRHTGTTSPLLAMAQHGLIDADDAAKLREAWALASRLRNASVLWRGRPVDSLPGSLADADGIARILGSPVGSGYQLSERYLRVSRRAREVVEQEFYGTLPDADRDADPTR
ncbi:MAG TPA: bifunctional [glutamine synthetase] adenylyltransferase/[glutamine synthetase]-adenylyl-L-tyrosine phosphorylase [Flexivirga sp.]|uniref:bifunctional [glutamine synthetase] adenylyltransferase/[glutamine synthetase]-adenylyl-L-tyrosine phosphorylase n=1 Tax=Flexivirga sp. TaxID=1962927 RepID=UPI002C0C1ED0|nr:bifunctional [glutamine synthetase] adenylyltransferase/[glutamine synthetase]-adenylyl-L-tyrosine phosphorylase [Flexivirga sp.]HWC23957.1 bifunctional [glutamine synthetase] adenylyltransferase/[glutamine synthetase]-adenylyl-L-tyrosine phosphorylase [Flexivirga sp.]